MSFLRRLFGKVEPDAEPAPGGGESSEFSVGDRVKDAIGNTGTITAIDPQAEHGLGIVTVKMDDGREVNLALMASGLEQA